MIEWWQHIPEQLNPIAFTIGFFAVRFYALAWLVGSFLAFHFFLRQIREADDKRPLEDWYDLFLGIFIGALLGGHLGYALLYQPHMFFTDPLRLLLPYDLWTGAWTGISGMSFHGGVLGVIVAVLLFVRQKKVDFFSVADRLVVAVPIALFFGRIGNFLNQELFGRLTTVPWGMYFPGASFPGLLRHPSALYEAFGEGVFLFVTLFFVGRWVKFPGGMSAVFLVLYGMIRWLLEFFREPDLGAPLLYGMFTLGQIYSSVMILSGTILFLWLRKKNRDTLSA